MSAIILWTLFGYLCGSIPFAVIVGKLVVKVDPRSVGDGNPGGSNVWMAGGWKIGIVTAILEIFKGFLPMYLARRAGLSEWALIPIGLSPILGHATQPFLGWRGGKALGATGGVWLALIGFLAFPVYAFGALPALMLQVEHAYAALAGMLVLVAYAVLMDGSGWLVSFALLNTALIFWTHQKAINRPWQWRSWVSNLFLRKSA